MKLRLEIKDDTYQLILNSSTDLTIGLLSFGYDVAQGYKFGLGKCYESFDNIPKDVDFVIDHGSVEDLSSNITFFLDVIKSDSIDTYRFDMPKVPSSIDIKPRDKALEIPVFEDGYYIKSIFQDSEHTIEVTFECEGEEFSVGLLDDGGFYVDEDLKNILESGDSSAIANAVDDICEWVDFDYWSATILGSVDEENDKSSKVPPSKED